MFQSIGGLLPDAIRRAKIEPQVKATGVMREYLEAAAALTNLAPLERLAQPRVFRQGTLVVRVQNSAVAAELRVYEQEIMNRIKQKIGTSGSENTIRRIKYEVGRPLVGDHVD